MPSGQGTPEETAATFREAMMAGQWERALACMTLEARGKVIAGLCLGGAYAADGNQAAGIELAAIVQRYGLRETARPHRDADELEMIFRDLVAWSARCLAPGKALDLSGQLSRTTYSEFRVDGDSAYAISTVDGRRSEVRFRRMDGLWYYR